MRSWTLDRVAVAITGAATALLGVIGISDRDEVMATLFFVGAAVAEGYRVHRGV